MVYLKEYSYNWESLGENIKEDLWSAIEILHAKFSRVDQAKLIAIDIITKLTDHFEKIREAKTTVLVKILVIGKRIFKFLFLGLIQIVHLCLLWLLMLCHLKRNFITLEVLVNYLLCFFYLEAIHYRPQSIFYARL